MRALLLAMLVIAGCQSQNYVTRDELRDLLAVPTVDHAELSSGKLDAVVKEAFEPPGNAAAALAVADGRTSKLAAALSSLDVAYQVCANNIANAETTAFKRTRAGFDTDGHPIFWVDLEQGSLENTGRQLDLGISGQGFFKVKIANSIGDGVGYTRNGNFFVNSEGDLVLGMGDGYKLMPPIKVPRGTTDVTISQDGVVSVRVAGQADPQEVGQLQLWTFVSPENLHRLGGSMFTKTESSGPPSAAKPADEAGQVLQGFLESSNVDLSREMIRMRFLSNWRTVILKAIDAAR